MNTFVRDDELVAGAAGNSGAPIERSGAYVGVFTQAKQKVAKTGTRGIEFTFEAVDGSTARFLSLWVERANGERIPYSYGLLSGLMVCLDLKSISSESVLSDEWDVGLGTRIPTKIEVYPELVNRQLGILLQREEQEWDGRQRVTMKIVDFFNPLTRQTPAEILGGGGATGQLERLVTALKERVLRPPPPTVTQPAAASAGAAFVDFSEDDIPF